MNTYIPSKVRIKTDTVVLVLYYFNFFVLHVLVLVLLILFRKVLKIFLKNKTSLQSCHFHLSQFSQLTRFFFYFTKHCKLTDIV